MAERKSDNLIQRLKNQEIKNIYTLYPPFPKGNLLIEVTNACNHQCIFCANRKMTRKKGTINPSLLKKVLYEAYTLGTREVGFYTTGEPLLNNDLESCIKIAKLVGYKYIYLTTNGDLATPERVERLVKCGLDSIKFSINAINRNEYQFIHGVDCLDKVMANLQEVYNLRKENNYPLKLYVSYIMTRFTNLEAKEIKNYFSNFCDDIVILKVRNQNGLTPEINKFLNIEKGEIDIPVLVKLPCSLPFNGIYVSYEGYLTSCCADFQNYLAYADLNKVTLKEAWNNETIINLRKLHLDKKVEGTLCSNCIEGSKIVPKPLVSDLASVFTEDMFDDKICENRIKNYLNI